MGRLTGQEGLAVRASKKLRSEELLVPSLAGTRLRMELDRIPLWRGDHVPVRQLAEDFARYVYLPRLSGPDVIAAAVRDGLGLLLWQQESFAYADSFDETTNRYRGLRCGVRVDTVEHSGEGLVVQPDVATRQQQAAAAAMAGAATKASPGPTGPESTGSSGAATGGAPRQKPQVTRFHGTVVLDAGRVGRDAGRIAEEVIAHLTGLVGSNVTVALEIDATVPSGVPDNVVRTVTENSRTLKFSTHGFESE